MLIKPSRRDLVKYGIGLPAFGRMSHAQMMMGINNFKAPAAGGSIALISHTSVAGAAVSSIDTTGTPISTIGANFIVALQAGFNGSVGTFADSKSNTWSVLTTYGTTFRTRLVLCVSPTTDAAHTFSITSSANFPTIAVAAFSGVKTSGTQDGTETGLGDQAVPTTIQAGSQTAAGSNELFISALIEFGVGDVQATIDSGFTRIETLAGNGVTFGYGFAYKINGTTENPIWTGNSLRSTTLAIFNHA